MIRIYVNNTDITANVQYQSLAITDQLNNRRNTARFTVNGLTISEAQKVEIYKGSKLSSAISAGVSSFVLDEVYDKWTFLRAGDQILVDFETANEELVTVQSVNPTTRTVSLTGNTRYAHSKGVFIGKKVFAGVTLKNPREEIGKSDILTYSVDCVDLSTIYDTHNVVDTYVNMYAREIIGRIVYKYTAPDLSKDFSDIETTLGVVASGLATSPVLDTTDKIYKNKSVQLGSSGAGSATYSITPPSFFFDGDFDEGGVNSTYTWKAGNAGPVSFPTTGGVNGGKCVKISLTAGNYVELQSHFAGYFGTGGYAIKPNTKYMIRGWLKVVGTGNMVAGGAMLGLLTSNSGGGSAGEFWTTPFLADSSGWQYVEKAFTTSASAVTAHSAVNFYNHNGSSTFNGDVYADGFTISEVIDVSPYDNLRFWEKMPSNVANWISAERVRMISSAGNYYEWTDARLYDGVWSFDSFDFNRATITGNPDITAISAIEITLTATKAIPAGTFKIDHVFFTKGGFTLRGTEKGNVFFKDVRAQYKKPTVLTENLSKNDGFSWYVDAFGDVRYFANENRVAPFSIVAPTGKNYGFLKVTADITNLKNRVVVRGGIAPSDFLYSQKHVCDGKETSYRLDYPPKDLSIYTSTDNGVTWSPRTSGVENLVSDTSVEFVFNFSEKTVRNGSISVLAQGTILRLDYYPYKDVRVSAQDDVSIARMKTLLGGDGIFDGAVINDASLRTFDEARARAKAELEAYSNPVLTATFQTEVDGLEAGQTIRVTDATYGVDQDFVIQKIDKRVRDNSGIFLYGVQAGTTLYGLTEFFQFLLKAYGTGNIDTAELVDRVQPVNEVLISTDTLTATKKSNTFFAHSRNGSYAYTLTFTEGGTSNDAYADFCTAS